MAGYGLVAAATDQTPSYELDLQSVYFTTKGATEGRTAFREKRPAAFHRK